jgi:hypothetical protein
MIIPQLGGAGMPVETMVTRSVAVEMMTWDGTPERRAEVEAWVADEPPPVDNPSVLSVDYTGCAELWVERQDRWQQIPSGARIAKDPYGNGFYVVTAAELEQGYDAA